MALKYKVGDRVRIKSLDWYNENKSKRGFICFDYANFIPEMSRYCGETLTINRVVEEFEHYLVLECAFSWTDEMIEGLVEEEMKSEDGLLDEYEELTDRAFKGGYEKCKSDIELNGFQLPDGYIFKDENGNVINATKIVLEKKKKEYPKTYGYCCDTLECCSYNVGFDRCETSYDDTLHNKLLALRKLIICRDAYWKIAGEEMGLGKPWKPDWDDDEWPDMYYISFDGKYLEKEKGYPCCNMILIFPTEEMRDAFYENFKGLIEECKELL